jgi:hypothetical protein
MAKCVQELDMPVFANSELQKPRVYLRAIVETLVYSY